MTSDARRLLEEALALSAEERQELGEALLESTGADSQESVQRAWRDEVLQRVEEVRSGDVTPEPYSDVKRHIREALER